MLRFLCLLLVIGGAFVAEKEYRNGADAAVQSDNGAYVTYFYLSADFRKALFYSPSGFLRHIRTVGVAYPTLARTACAACGVLLHSGKGALDGILPSAHLVIGDYMTDVIRPLLR